MIWDGSPIHRRVEVKNFVSSTRGKVWLEAPPGYAPDLNPWHEGGWNHLKHVQSRNAASRDLEELHEQFHLEVSEVDPIGYPGLFTGSRTEGPLAASNVLIHGTLTADPEDPHDFTLCVVLVVRFLGRTAGGGRGLVGSGDQRRGASAGAAVDQGVRITEQFAAAPGDRRNPAFVQQPLLALVRQRIYGILADYEDQNDHDDLRSDPVFKGKRTAENTEALVEEFRSRTGGRLMWLMTSVEDSAYEAAILHAYGETVTPLRTGKRGRPRGSYRVAPPGLTYATVAKRRENGRVVEIGTRIVFGTVAAVLLALGMSKVSRAINTAFVERRNGTDRHRNARKARKTYRFSKSWRHHEAVTYLSLYCYNFCWPVRTLRIEDDQGNWRKRSLAMAARLADHVWSMAEWLSRSAVQRS